MAHSQEWSIADHDDGSVGEQAAVFEQSRRGMACSYNHMVAKWSCQKETGFARSDHNLGLSPAALGIVTADGRDELAFQDHDTLELGASDT